ncbi:hypothetical protein [Sphingomonas montana]|uniref:hypothetical protein n=1 Tax=Sphingomonas montana TaxID=1843236 RepID=UPI0009700938|nr:hypothetical protein [Sphingomonas montana]
MQAFAQPDMAITDSADYLSCAVKHPCSTMVARWAMGQPEFHRDPAVLIEPFIAGLQRVEPSGPAAWTAAPISALRAIMADL